MYKIRKNQDENAYSMLHRNNGEVACDFCERTFKNRYKSIIHNAYHIVIPLIKQEVHQCSECLYYFTSTEELSHHVDTKHRQTHMNIKTEPEDDVKDLFVYNYNLNIYKSNNFKMKTEEYILPDVCEEQITYSNVARINTIARINNNVASIDDTVAKIETNVAGENAMSGDGKEIVSDSVHFDQLMLPGLFKCSHCDMKFTNRFQLVQHGTVHIIIKKGRPLLCTICDKYIAGNHCQLSKHVAEKHPNRTNRPRSKTRCNMCGLKYHKYARHLANYHPDLIERDVSISDMSNFGEKSDMSNFGTKSVMSNFSAKSDMSNFGAKSDMSNFGVISDMSNFGAKRDIDVPNTIIDHKKSSVFNICQTCLPFLKKKSNLKYFVIGTVNKMGVRHKCSKCCKLFFEIKLVKRIATANDSKCNLHFEEDLPRKKSITNRERLKNIQMRLKMINKLSKFCTLFHF